MCDAPPSSGWQFRVHRARRGGGHAFTFTAVFPFLIALAVAASSHADGTLKIGFEANSGSLQLRGRDASQQILATLEQRGAGERDVTREVLWTIDPPELALIDARGRVFPRFNGSGRIMATEKKGASASLPLEVREVEASPEIHFENQIIPILTRYGCNGGGCHGKAAGQNGFRLSLLGFEPGEDYDHLVREARGRRLFPAAPERSLLLLKATAEVPHGGGQRMTSDSEDYQVLIHWIEQGMPLGDPNAPRVSTLEVFPSEGTLALGTSQQLVVTAHYTDGSREDVTYRALYESSDSDLARCDAQGLLDVLGTPGEISVMIRYQGLVATFRGTLPLGAPVTNLPPARNFVDDEIFDRLRKVGIPASELCDDATFIRRVTLDIAGRLPTVGEVESFLGEGPRTNAIAREKARDALIERLLASSDYADYFANKWSALLRNRRNEPKHSRGAYAFHGWIRDSLLNNTPYDEFVREILTASGEVTENPPVVWYRQVRTMQSQLEDVAQLFLGQRLQCAQCHHHPYERWSQTDYWSFGAFFSRVGYVAGAQPGEESIVHRRGIAQATNKKSGRPVTPSSLGETPTGLTNDDDPRMALAEWMTRRDNPFFARALVNRYWKHFFGRGLVEPEDDLRDTNPATHPVLLNALAKHFAESGYDLKELIRTLTRSTTYQLSSFPNAWNGSDRHHFARFQSRRLPAETLYDAINAMLAKSSNFEGMPAGSRAVCLPDNSFNAGNYFLTVFGRPDSSTACECERTAEASLSQSLHLLNAKEIHEGLVAATNRIAALARDTSRSSDAKIRELFLLAYAREPRSEEAKVVLTYLNKKPAAEASAPAPTGSEGSEMPPKSSEPWEDLTWALMNTKEFLFNH